MMPLDQQGQTEKNHIPFYTYFAFIDSEKRQFLSKIVTDKWLKHISFKYCQCLYSKAAGA
jgi:hypothetical protein